MELAIPFSFFILHNVSYLFFRGKFLEKKKENTGSVFLEGK
jgi:hypothetical protein